MPEGGEEYQGLPGVLPRSHSNTHTDHITCLSPSPSAARPTGSLLGGTAWKSGLLALPCCRLSGWDFGARLACGFTLETDTLVHCPDPPPSPRCHSPAAWSSACWRLTAGSLPNNCLWPKRAALPQVMAPSQRHLASNDWPVWGE